MTTKKREDREGRNALNVPAQEDEADIVDEVRAEQDEETGELSADAERVREAGALDPASVRQNRHINRVADKKRKGEKVSFGIDDPIVLYEALNKVWPNDKVNVHAQNLVTREVHIIRSHPRSGADLYELLRAIHGPREAQEYKIEFRSASRQEYLGIARLTMPDARPSGQQGQPSYYQPPPQYSPQSPAAQAAPVPQPTPTFVMPPPGGDPMAMVGQVFDLFQRFQAQMAPQAQPQQHPNVPNVLPPPPQTSDPAAMMNWMQQAFGIFQQMQLAARGQPQPQAQPQAAPPSGAPMGMPPFQPPPGTTWVYVPNAGWVAQALGVGVGSSGAPPQRSPFQRPAYYPQGDPNGGAPPQDPRYPPYGQRVAPERSPIQAFRESVSMMRDARNVAQEFSDIFGGGGGPEPPEVAEDDDDSPIKIIETGHGKLAVNRSDGALRWAETGLMLLPDVFKWIGEQHDKIQTAQRQKQQPAPPRRVLAPGYVEVDQNYVPPKGYVAVPIEATQDELPEPPPNVPPAIDEQEEEQQRPAWGAPVIPQNG
jgi:hypothetical protein